MGVPVVLARVPSAEKLGEAWWIELSMHAINCAWSAARDLALQILSKAACSEHHQTAFWEMLCCALNDGVPGLDLADADDAVEASAYMQHTLFCLITSANLKSANLATRLLLLAVSEDCRRTAGVAPADWVVGVAVSAEEMADDPVRCHRVFGFAVAYHGLRRALKNPVHVLRTALLPAL